MAFNKQTLITGYLTVYNVIQTIGYGVALVSMLMPLYHHASYQHAFLTGAAPASWHQLLAFLEIVHAATGIVKSSPMNNFWQWLGRSNALFVFALRVPELQQDGVAVAMLMIWCLGEVTRYPWYAATLMEDCPVWLTWLRYTAFIPLYPLGVVAEMLLLYRGVPYVRKQGILTIDLPNTWNFAWDHARFVEVMLFLYPFLWWQNYSSLLRQRKPKIAAARGAAAAAAAANREKYD